MLGLLAYFDPGSGSLLLQLLLGGAGGLFVVGKTLWKHYFFRLEPAKSSDVAVGK